MADLTFVPRPHGLAMPFIVLGKLIRPHGLRGELLLHRYNEASPVWRRGSELAVFAAEPDAASAQGDVVDGDPSRHVIIDRLRPAPKGRTLVVLRGVDSREAAEALCGLHVAVPVEALAPPEDDEIYFHEVPGWAVETEAGDRVGSVVAVIQVTQDLLEVRPEGGGETFYLPLVADVVKRIDRPGRRIVIDPLEGLLP